MGGWVWTSSALSSKHGCEPKTALKIKSFFLFLNKRAAVETLQGHRVCVHACACMHVYMCVFDTQQHPRQPSSEGDP